MVSLHVYLSRLKSPLFTRTPSCAHLAWFLVIPQEGSRPLHFLLSEGNLWVNLVAKKCTLLYLLSEASLVLARFPLHVFMGVVGCSTTKPFSLIDLSWNQG
jgi:hypothetical protein